jgi:hypothetical protein
MSEFGLHFDQRVQQRESNGLLGMFANDFIPSGTVLAKFRLSKGIPISKEIDFTKTSGNLPVTTVQLVHSMARELSNSRSIYKPFFEYCGSLEDRRSSVCFFEQSDFEALAKISPFLANSAFLSHASFTNITNSVVKADPSLSADSIALATFISRERCWAEFGFMSGMDLFNHNTEADLRPIAKTINGQKYAAYVSSKDFQPDEEIKISYGAKDIYAFAINYNFFDSNSLNIIDFSERIFPPIKDEFTSRVIKNLQKNFKVNFLEHSGVRRIQVVDCNAHFLREQPNSSMIELASLLAISSERELRHGRAEKKSILEYLLTIIDTMLTSNYVSEYRIEEVPDKLKLFYNVLAEEKEQLERNRLFVTERC